MRSACWFFLLAALLLVFSVSACKQKEGNRCQVDSDCENGLVCCVSKANILAGGRCFMSGRCDLTTQDSGVSDGKLTPHPDQAKESPVGADKTSDTKPTLDVKPAGDTKPGSDLTPSVDLKAHDTNPLKLDVKADLQKPHEAAVDVKAIH